MENKIKGLKKGEKLARRALFLEGFLAAAKAIVGTISGSAVLLSDAVHSASDLMPIFASWLGLKISQKEPDKKFPYGYYKAENLAALLISLLVTYAGYNILREGINLLQSSSNPTVPILAMAVSITDAIVLFFFGNLEIKVGKEINSKSLITMGKENRTHVFTSSAVLLGIISSHFSLPYIEGGIIIIISLLIFEIGLTSLKDSLFALMDIGPGKEIVAKVAKTINSISAIEEVINLKLRKSGTFIFGEAVLGIRKSIDVQRAHQIASRVEKRVKQKIPQVDSLNIQFQPCKTDFHHLVIPVQNKEGLNSKISKKFGRANYFFFANLKKDQIKGNYFLKNKYQDKKAKAGLSAAKQVINQKADILICKQIGEISFYALRENLFDIYRTKKNTAKKAIKEFNNSKLQTLQSPKKIT